MSLTISSPTVYNQSQNTTLNKSNVVLSSTLSNDSLIPNTSTSNNLLKPSPIIQVNENPATNENVIESPYIKATEQSADKNNLNSQNYSQPNSVDQRPQQIRNLSAQQQDIQSRKQQLNEQEIEINREISQLQQKELEINRKKFQLQQQTTGNFLNIQV